MIDPALPFSPPQSHLPLPLPHSPHSVPLSSHWGKWKLSLVHPQRPTWVLSSRCAAGLCQNSSRLLRKAGSLGRGTKPCGALFPWGPFFLSYIPPKDALASNIVIFEFPSHCLRCTFLSLLGPCSSCCCCIGFNSLCLFILSSKFSSDMPGRHFQAFAPP